jgi:hypothetical protein
LSGQLAKLIDLGCEQLLARPADIQLRQQLFALRQDAVFVQPEAGVRRPDMISSRFSGWSSSARKRM